MRLHDYVALWRDRAFEPGSADCAQFVRGWVLARTGHDHGAGYDYRTLEDGANALIVNGHADHVALVASVLPEVHPVRAQVGDVAAVASEAGDVLGILAGEHVYVVGPRGLHSLPRRTMTRAFACRA